MNLQKIRQKATVISIGVLLAFSCCFIAPPVYAADVAPSEAITEEEATFSGSRAATAAEEESVAIPAGDKTVLNIVDSGSAEQADTATLKLYLDAASTVDSDTCIIELSGAYAEKITVENEGSTAIREIVLSKNSPEIIEFTLASEVDTSAITSGKQLATVKISSSQGKNISIPIHYQTSSVYITDIKVTPSSVAMAEGDTKVIKTSFVPSSATRTELNWSSSDSNVVTVDPDSGLLTANGPGKAVITIQPQEGEKDDQGEMKVKKQVEVTVYQPMSPEASVVIKPIKDGDNPTGILEDNIQVVQESGEEKIKVDGILQRAVLLSLDGMDNENHEGISWRIKQGSSTEVVGINAAGQLSYKGIGGTILEVKGSQSGLTKDVAVQVDEVPVTEVIITLPVDKPATPPADPDAPPTPPTHVSQVTIGKGLSVALTATVLPDNATDKKVTWKSSDTNVATVSSKGVIKGIKPGTANVTATSGQDIDGNPVVGTIAVTVKEQVKPVLEFYKVTTNAEGEDELGTELGGDYGIDKPKLLTSGEVEKVGVKIKNADGGDKYAINPKITWRMSQSGIATLSVKAIDDTSMILSLKAGTSTSKAGQKARIVATNADNYPDLYFKLKPIAAESITITNIPKILEPGKQARALGIKVNPTNADKAISWSLDVGSAQASINNGAILINKNATFTEIEVTATAYTFDGDGNKIEPAAGAETSVTIKVGTPVKSAKLNTTSVTIPPLGEYQLQLGLTPYNIDKQKTIEYTSRDESIATVDSDGLITIVQGALAGEKVVIDVIIGDNEKKLTCKVTVGQAEDPDNPTPPGNFSILTDVTQSKTEYKMNVGRTQRMVYKLAPSSKALPSEVKWWVKDGDPDKDVVYVDDLGNVTAIGESDKAFAWVYGQFTGKTGVISKTVEGASITNNPYTVAYKIIVNPEFQIGAENVAGTVDLWDKRLKITLKENDIITIHGRVIPADAAKDSKLVWKTTSDYINVETGDNSIVVTAKPLTNKAYANATITVKDEVTRKSATISIRVEK